MEEQLCRNEALYGPANRRAVDRAASAAIDKCAATKQCVGPGHTFMEAVEAFAREHFLTKTLKWGRFKNAVDLWCERQPGAPQPAPAVPVWCVRSGQSLRH